MRDRIEAAIVADSRPMRRFSGRRAERLANTTFFAIPGMKAETAQIAFDLAGVALSAGSACSSGKVGPSHVLKAMGMATMRARCAFRSGIATTEDEIARLQDGACREYWRAAQ